MAAATFRHGDAVMADYTPGGGNVAAGSVVLLGNLAGISCGIAHQDIANNALGALAIGGGVYDVTMITNMAPWALAYWDATNSKVTSTSTNNAVFGALLTGNTGANTVVEAFHNPMAPRV